jgi:general secretion pathway protein G
MKMYSCRRNAFTLMELMAVLAILGLLATVILPRVVGGSDSGETAACHTHKGDIEIQAELWITNTGAWPAADLSTISGDLNYFPSGLPTCPVDQSSYTIDPSTGRVIGHNH